MEEAVDCDCDDKTNNGEAHDDVVEPFKLIRCSKPFKCKDEDTTNT